MLKAGSAAGLSVIPPDSSPFVFDSLLQSSKSLKFKKRKRFQIELEFEAYTKIHNHSKLELDIAASPFLYEKLCRGETSTYVCKTRIFIQ